MPAATTDRRICMGRMGASVFCGCYPAKYRSTDSGSATNIKFTRVRVLAAEPARAREERVRRALWHFAANKRL